MREERRLRVFENKVLRRIFGPKKDEVTGEWRTLHNEEFTYLYCTKYYSGVQLEKHEVGGACSTYGREKSFVQVFGGET